QKILVELNTKVSKMTIHSSAPNSLQSSQRNTPAKGLKGSNREENKEESSGKMRTEESRKSMKTPPKSKMREIAEEIRTTPSFKNNDLAQEKIDMTPSRRSTRAKNATMDDDFVADFEKASISQPAKGKGKKKAPLNE